VYTVQKNGETLQSIAKTVWGDAKLWYLIADANDIGTATAPLTAGQLIKLPARINTVNNDAQTFKPYDPSKVIGATTPNLAPPIAQECGGYGQIIVTIVAIVVAIVVTVYSLGTGTAAAVAAVEGAAAGNVAGQVVGNAIGTQDGFSFKSLALAVVSAEIGGEVPGAEELGGGVSGVIAHAAIANAVTQGIGVVTGLQKSFDWRGVVASGVGAGVGAGVGVALGDNGKNPVFGDSFGGQLARGAVNSFASGLATAVARGGRVSVVQVAVDSFGNALGNAIAGSITTQTDAEKIANAQQQNPSLGNGVSSATQARVQSGQTVLDYDPEGRSFSTGSLNSPTAANDGFGNTFQVGIPDSERSNLDQYTPEGRLKTLTGNANRTIIDIAASNGQSLTPTIDNAAALGLYVGNGTGDKFVANDAGSGLNLGTRALGLAQFAGGLAGAFASGSAIAAGAVAAPETLGASLLLSAAGYVGFGASADQASAGLQTFLTGNATRSLAGQGIEYVTGASPQASEFSAGLLTLSPTAVEAGIFNKGTRALGAANTAARGTYIGFGSATDNIYDSMRPLANEFPELNGVNPHYVENAGPGVNTNCVSCVNAAQQRLTGQASDAVADATKYSNQNGLLPSAPFGFGPTTTPAGVVEELIQAGTGTTRPLIIQQPGNIQHVINVVNRDGIVYFIDSQMGQIVTLHPNIPVKLGRP
jgi:hypothetical protein